MKNLFGEESEAVVPTAEVSSDPLATVAKSAADRFEEHTGKRIPFHLLFLLFKQVIGAEKRGLSPEHFASRLSEELEPKVCEAVGQTVFAF
jgi:hypothetical protein